MWIDTFIHLANSITISVHGDIDFDVLPDLIQLSMSIKGGRSWDYNNKPIYMAAVTSLQTRGRCEPITVWQALRGHHPWHSDLWKCGSDAGHVARVIADECSYNYTFNGQFHSGITQYISTRCHIVSMEANIPYSPEALIGATRLTANVYEP